MASSNPDLSNAARPPLPRTASTINVPAPPVTAPLHADAPPSDAVLEFNDGTAYSGISFGAEGKSVAGECVFQTGIFTLLNPSYLI